MTQITLAIGGFPRSRGDEPFLESELGYILAFSPLTRG